MESRDDFFGKKIVILGLGRQGKALARFALSVGAEVVISDMRTIEEMQEDIEEFAELSVDFVLGEHPISLLDNTDVLAISGGVPTTVPVVQEAQRRGILITNDSMEFMRRTPATVIGITGSAGKTTTTALTGAMLEASGLTTWVGGNIGRPLLSDLDKMQPDHYVVQELSSFQLEQWTMSPPVAAILNITPNHLDRHKSMEAYSRAKSNILRFQSTDGVAILSADDPGAQSVSHLVRGRLREFSLNTMVGDGVYLQGDKIWLRNDDGSKLLCTAQDIPLRGRHNILNVQAAALLADSVGADSSAIKRAVMRFSGVEHRLELVGTIYGVQYINDSIATAPERAIAAIDSFLEPVILLAGGKDKNMVWSDWVKKVHQTVKAVLLFGDLGVQLEEYLLTARDPHATRPYVKRMNTLDEAVTEASSIAEEGDVVLLAPGGTSFDTYPDFSVRGEHFRQLVNKLRETTKKEIREFTDMDLQS